MKLLRIELILIVLLSILIAVMFFDFYSNSHNKETVPTSPPTIIYPSESDDESIDYSIMANNYEN